jgi:hypothetical protein
MYNIDATTSCIIMCNHAKSLILSRILVSNAVKQSGGNIEGSIGKELRRTCSYIESMVFCKLKSADLDLQSVKILMNST